MSKRPFRPPESRWLTPYLTVADVAASMALYERAFGFEPGLSMPGPDGQAIHGEVAYQGKTLAMMGPEGAWGSTKKTPAKGVPCPVGLYVYCEDVDAMIARAVAAGLECVSEPEQMFWGDRLGCVRDCDGYEWTFATNVADFDPSMVPSFESGDAS